MFDSENNSDSLNKLLSSIASGYAGIGNDLKNQLKKIIMQHLKDLDLVSKEEFEIVKEMLAESRKSQEHLLKKISDIEEIVNRNK